MPQDSKSSFIIPTITIDSDGCSLFSECHYDKNPMGERLLSSQIETVNLRLRESAVGYQSDWHVAGDPTLIIILQGCMRIYLQNGESRDFKQGDLYIAGDYTPEGTSFDPLRHGTGQSLLVIKI